MFILGLTNIDYWGYTAGPSVIPRFGRDAPGPELTVDAEPKLDPLDYTAASGLGWFSCSRVIREPHGCCGKQLDDQRPTRSR